MPNLIAAYSAAVNNTCPASAASRMAHHGTRPCPCGLLGGSSWRRTGAQLLQGKADPASLYVKDGDEVSHQWDANGANTVWACNPVLCNTTGCLLESLAMGRFACMPVWQALRDKECRPQQSLMHRVKLGNRPSTASLLSAGKAKHTTGKLCWIAQERSPLPLAAFQCCAYALGKSPQSAQKAARR